MSYPTGAVVASLMIEGERQVVLVLDQDIDPAEGSRFRLTHPRRAVVVSLTAEGEQTTMNTLTAKNLHDWLDASAEPEARALADLLYAYEDIADSLASYHDERVEVQWCSRHKMAAGHVPATCCNSFYDDEFGRCKHQLACVWEPSWLVRWACPKCEGDSWEEYECDMCAGRGKPR